MYFTHPYTNCEKGTVEYHNHILRRFVSKGKSIDDYTADEIMIFTDIINRLPRKLLGYCTPPKELFEANSIVFSPHDTLCCTEFAFSLVAALLPLRQIRSICETFANYCNLLLQFARKIHYNKRRFLKDKLRIFSNI